MSSSVLSTSRSPSSRRLGLLVRAFENSQHTGPYGGPDDLEVPRRKRGVVPFQDVTLDGGLAFQVQARDFPAQGLEGPRCSQFRRRARAASFYPGVLRFLPGPGNQPERGHDAGQQQGSAEELSEGRGAVGAFSEHAFEWSPKEKRK